MYRWCNKPCILVHDGWEEEVELEDEDEAISDLDSEHTED